METKEIDLKTIQQYDIVLLTPISYGTLCCVMGVLNDMLFVEPILGLASLNFNNGNIGAILVEGVNNYKAIVAPNKFWGYSDFHTECVFIRRQYGKRPRKSTFLKIANKLKEV